MLSEIVNSVIQRIYNDENQNNTKLSKGENNEKDILLLSIDIFYFNAIWRNK